MASITDSSDKIQLLLVEDDQIDCLAFTRAVKQYDLPYEYNLASSLSEALAILSDRTFQIAILDYNLGDGKSSELFPTLKAQNCPFVISTGSGDEETAARLMELGAADYLIKDPERKYLKVLPATISKTLSRHQTEWQLQLLNRAIQSVKDGIYILDFQGNIQYINNTLAEFCGVSPEVAIGQPIQILNQPYLEEWLEKRPACATEICSIEVEIIICRADGTNYLALISETCVIEDLHFSRIGVIRDIISLKAIEQELRLSQESLENTVKERTAELQQAIAELRQENQERLKIEESLRESQKRFESLAAVAPVGIFRTDTTGDAIYLNDRWCEIAGLTVAEASGSNWSKALHPDDRAKVGAEWYASVQEHRPFELECRFQKPDGTVTWVLSRARAEHDIYGEIIGYVGTITDISDRKRAETVLQKLVTGTAAVTGADFFVELVRHIAEALDIAYALVTEVVDERLVSLGFWANGSLQPTISYVPAKTPCERCMQLGQYHCKESVQTVFAEDLDLVNMQAESYLGISLRDDHGKVIGNLCVLDTKPISETKMVEAIGILQVFGARASAELQRKNVNEALNRLNLELEERVHERTQDLQDRERFLQTVLDSFPLAVFWKDRQSILLGSNQFFAQMSGLESPLEVIGKTNFDFSFTKEEALKYLEDDQAVMESGIPKIGIEETYTSTNGEVNWLETNKIPLRNGSGEVVGMVGTAQDISDRKRAEQTLAESEAFNRQLVTEFPIGLASCRMDGQLIFVNEVYAQILGRTVDETLSLTYWDITPIKYADQEAEQLRLIQTEGRYDPYEKEYIHKDGHLVPVLLSGIKIFQNGEYFIWSSIQDISDRKNTEAKLQLVNQELIRATRLKDEFLANMSHELRTPLNAILGMTEGLQEEVFGIVNEKQLKALNTVERGASHLLVLINDILDLAKIESGKIILDPSPVSIEQLCSSSLAFVKQQALDKRIQIKTTIPPHLSDLFVDETRMRQVLLNLLTNAVKFTLEGGSVTLAVAVIPAEPPGRPIRTLQIAITDTGIGITSEHIAKLFQPFVQIDSALNRKYAGTGLGLALVKKIVELHGGDVKLTSELGIGSCFTIELPYQSQTSTHGLAIAPKSDHSQPNAIDQIGGQIGDQPSQSAIAQSPLVLLAEDNPGNVMTITSYLEAKGYRLLLANDGQEAIDFAISHQPDLILMDVQMPIIDGLEAMRQIRQQQSLHDIPIIALTALAMKGDQERCLAAGANQYLSKPVKLKQLDNLIKEMLQT